MLWKPGVPIAPKTRIFLLKEDLDDLRLTLYDKPIPIGLEVIELTPRAAEHISVVHAISHANEFDLLAKRSALDRSSANALIARFDPSLREVLTTTLEFLHAVWLKDAAESSRLAEPLRAVLTSTKTIPSSSRNWATRLVRYLAIVVDGAMRIWSWPTVYEHSIPQAKYRSWWNFAPTLPRWAEVSEQYRTIVTLAAPQDIAAVKKWVDNFQTAASSLQLQGQASEANSFFCASAYLMTLAEHFSTRRQPILALLAVHRAAEWLMVARLAQANALAYTQGIRLKQGSEEVTFQKALLACLLQNIVTAPEKQVFEALNEWRNLLIYTHHMSSPPEMVVHDLMSKLRPIIHRVGASDWKQHYSNLSAEIPVDFALVLDPGSHLRSGMRLVSSEELEI